MNNGGQRAILLLMLFCSYCCFMLLLLLVVAYYYCNNNNNNNNPHGLCTSQNVIFHVIALVVPNESVAVTLFLHSYWCKKCNITAKRCIVHSLVKAAPR